MPKINILTKCWTSNEWGPFIDAIILSIGEVTRLRLLALRDELNERRQTERELEEVLFRFTGFKLYATHEHPELPFLSDVKGMESLNLVMLDEPVMLPDTFNLDKYQFPSEDSEADRLCVTPFDFQIHCYDTAGHVVHSNAIPFDILEEYKS